MYKLATQLTEININEKELDIMDLYYDKDLWKHATWILQCFVAGTTLLASVSTGAALGYPSVLLYQLRKKDSPIHIDLDSASWIGSVHGTVGIFSILMPFLMQWRGRKLAFLISIIILLMGWVTAYFANSVATILITEALHGFGANSLLTVSYFCIGEMITPEHRNVYIQTYAIMQSFGLAGISVMTRYIHWKTVSLIMAVPTLLSALSALTWRESPAWLALKGKIDKCETNFLWLRGNDEDSIKELKEMISCQTENLRKETNKSAFKKLCQEVRSRDFYVPALHVLVLFILCYLGGSIVILLYAIELIQKTSNSEDVAFYGSVGMNFILFFGATFSSVLIKSFKNKHVLLLSAAGTFVCLLAASIVTYLQSIHVLAEDSLLCVYCLVAYMITSSLGFLPIAFTMASELMPVKHRGIGGSLIMLCTCSLHALALKSSPYLFVYIGLYGTFFFYSMNVLICSLLIWRFVPETKARTLQEIENFYMYGSFDRKILRSESIPIVKQSV